MFPGVGFVADQPEGAVDHVLAELPHVLAQLSHVLAERGQQTNILVLALLQCQGLNIFACNPLN